MLVIKKNVKHTKFSEIETEVTFYKDECLRMRHALEQAYGGTNTGSHTGKNSEM